MMFRKLWVGLAGLCVLMTAAVADEHVESAWFKRDRSELIQTFGRPQYVVSDGRDGHVMVYLPRETMTGGSSLSNAPLMSLALIEDKASAFRLFFVDKDETIYRVESKGSAFKWDPPWWW